MRRVKLDLAQVCREEWCVRTKIHAPHAMTPADEKAWRKEQEQEQAGRRSRGRQMPWQIHDHRGIDGAIARSVSTTYPKHIMAIVSDVVADYGSCNLRTVQRHIVKLVARGHLLRINVGESLYVYLRPGSAIQHDVALLRDQVKDAIHEHQQAVA